MCNTHWLRDTDGGRSGSRADRRAATEVIAGEPRCAQDPCAQAQEPLESPEQCFASPKAPVACLSGSVREQDAARQENLADDSVFLLRQRTARSGRPLTQQRTRAPEWIFREFASA